MVSTHVFPRDAETGYKFSRLRLVSGDVLSLAETGNLFSRTHLQPLFFLGREKKAMAGCLRGLKPPYG